MKHILKNKRLLLAGILVFCAALGWGDTYEWTGDADGNYINPANWLVNSSVPGSFTSPSTGDTVEFIRSNYAVPATSPSPATNIPATLTADSIAINDASFSLTLGVNTPSLNIADGSLTLSGSSSITGLTITGGSLSMGTAVSSLNTMIYGGGTVTSSVLVPLNTSLTLNANLNVSSLLDIGGSASVALNNSTLTVGTDTVGSLTAAGTCGVSGTLNVTTGLNLSGGYLTSGSVNFGTCAVTTPTSSSITFTGAAPNLAGLSAGIRDITLTNAGSLTVSSAVSSGGALTISTTSGGNILINDEVSAASTVTINSAGTTGGSGNITAGTTIGLTSSGTTNLTGEIKGTTLTLSGAADFTLTNAGNDINALATTGTAPTLIDFTDSDGIALGPINAAALTVNAGGAVTHGGAITSGTAVNVITTTGGIDLDDVTNAITGTFTASANGAVLLENTGNLEIQGITTTTGSGITVTNTGNIDVTTAAISTGTGAGNIALMATTGTLTIGQALSAGGGAIALANTGSGNALAINADVTTTGTVTINSAGSVGGSGAIKTAAAVTANGAAGVTLNGANTIEGTFAASAGTSGAVFLENTGDLEIQGITTTTGSGITVNNTGDIGVTTAAISTGTGAGDIDLTATTGTLTIGQALSAGGGTVSLATNTSGGITVNNTLSGNGISVTAAGTISGSGSIASTAAVDLSSGGATAAIGGTIAGTTLTLSGAADFTLTNAGNDIGTLQTSGTTGGIDYRDTNAFSTGTIGPSGNVSLMSGNNTDITIGGPLTAAGALSLKVGPNSNTPAFSTGDVIINANITAASLTAEARHVSRTAGTIAGNVEVWIDDSLSVFQASSFYANATAAPADKIYHYRQIPATVDLELNHDGITTVPGAFGIDASGLTYPITLSTSGNIYVTGTVTISGNLTLTNTAPAGFIEFRGGFTSSGTLILTPGSTGGVHINGGTIELSASGFNVSTAVIIGDNVSSTAGGSIKAAAITLGGTVNGTTAGANNLSLETTGGALTVTGAIGSTVKLGTLTVKSSAAMTLGTTSNDVTGLTVTGSGGAVSFTNVSALDIGGISGIGDNTVNLTTTSGDVTQSGMIIESGTGAVTIDSAGAITLGTLNNKIGTITIAGAGGTVAVKNDDKPLNIGGISGIWTNTVNLTTTISGAITQSGIITSGTVTVNSAGAVTLNTQNNKIGTITITGAGGAVAVKNDAQTLDVGGISSSIGNFTAEFTTTTSGDININGPISKGTGNLTLTSAGAIGTTGSITGTGGVVTLRSADSGDITIGGAISGIARLVLISGDGVSISPPSSGEVNINASITVTGASTGHTETTAAVYIWADDVKGSSPINLSSSSGEVCVWMGPANTSYSYTGSVTGSRIHTHFRNGWHLVYRPGSDPGNGNIPGAPYLDKTSPGNEYNYIDSTASSLTPLSYIVPANKNIYIIDVGLAHNRARTFAINGSAGFIEIRGVYGSNQPLTLTPGSGSTGGVHLGDGASDPAAVTLSASAFSTGGTRLTLLDIDASITAAGITLGGGIYRNNTNPTNIALYPTTGALSVTGTVGQSTATGRLGDITVTTIPASGTVTFDTTSTVYAASYTQTGGGAGLTTFGGLQNYTEGFSFTGTNLTIDGSVQTDSDNTGADGAFSFNGADFNLNNTLNTGTNAANIVTITNTGTFTKTNTGTITAGGSFTRNGSGPNSIGNSITASSISFAQAVLITGAATFTATIGNITLPGPLIGNGSNLTLWVNTGSGSITFGNAIGSLASAITIAGTPYSIGNHPLGTFTVTGYNVTTSSSVVPLDITAAGFTVNASTNVIPPGAMIVNGDTMNSGRIYASGVPGPEPDNAANAGLDWLTYPYVGWPAGEAYAIDFNGSYTEAVAGLLIGNNTRTLIAFRGSVVLGATPYPTVPITPPAPLLSGFGWMVFLGSGDQYFNGNTGARHLPNVLIYHTGGSGVVLSGTARQMGQKLLIRSGFLDSAYTTFPAATWVFGDTTTPSGFSSGFYNNSGELILYNGAGLRTNDLYTSNPGGNLTLNGSAGAGCVVRASGNVTVNKSFGVTGGAVLDDFTLVMNGTGTGPGVAAPYTVDGKELAAGSGAVVIGSLRVDSTGSQAHIIFASDITINGNVTIDDTGGTGAFLYGGEDRTSANSYHVKVLGNWTQYYDTNVMPTPDYTDDPFVPQMGTVEFARGDSARKVEIKGNTHWYNLECHEKGMTLQFGYYQSAHNNYHRITKGLNIDPSSPALTDRIFLTRTDPSAEPSHDSAKPTPTVGVNPAEYWVPPLNPTVDFWVFDLGIDPVSGESAEIELNNVEISYSYSIRRIPVPPVEGGSSRIVLAWPYIFAWQDASGNPVYADGTLVPLTLPSGASTADDLWRTPFSLYNKNWFVANNFFYSFTEDTNHNGKIDRIRLQSSFELVDTYFQNPSNGHYAFQEFDMIVDGYEIDRTRPGSYNGFARAGSTADKIDSIYVYLKERPYTDGGAVLNWRIVHNTSLLDLTTHQMLIGNAGDTGSTTDTVPPRISYAQVLPENPQIYFRMSENVDASPSTGLALDALSGPSTPRTGMVSAVNNTEFVIGTSRAYNVNELAGGKELFKIKQIRDLASQVIDIHHDPKRVYNYQYPSPRYPVDYNYQAYIIIEKENTINPKNPITEVRLPPHSLELLDSDLALPPLSLPPGTLLSHRVSDILISVPPVHGGDNRYFIWPVYARYTNPANPLIPRDVLWGQEDTDTGLIWDFSGRKFLEERNTTIQVRLNSALSGAWKAASVPFSVNMRYGVNVPNGYRYPPENNTKLQGSGGLWLPPVPPPPPNYPASYINLVPAFFDFAAFKAPVSVNNDAYSFEINKDEPGYDSVARVDFVFQIKEPSGNVNIPDDMYAARLDIKPGSPIPPDWYHKVRPFTYDIHNIRLQRGGVTILNNVINPTKGEKTYIRYHLMNGGRVTVQVFTMDGSLVKVIRREHREAGEWVDVWEGRNKGERAVARGMYFVRVVGPGIDEIRKVMVVK